MATSNRRRLTDNEIVELVRKYDRMIRMIAHKTLGPYANPDDRDDCIAEVRMQFVRAAQLFDPSRGNTFGTYAYRLGYVYARRWRQKVLARGVRIPEHLRGRATVKMRSLNDYERDVALPIDDDDARPAAPDDLSHIWKHLRLILTNRQIEILRYHFVGGESYRTISRRYGCTRSNINQVIKAALARIKYLAPDLVRYIDNDD